LAPNRQAKKDLHGQICFQCKIRSHLQDEHGIQR
jgi:hypothetical protein